MNSTYNKYPEIRIKGLDDECFSGWYAILRQLRQHCTEYVNRKKVIAVECYQGVDDDEVLTELTKGLQPELLINTRMLMKSHQEIEVLTRPDVTDDRIFGFITRLQMENFLDMERADKAREEIKASGMSVILVYGPGAALIAPPECLLVYADMARWEIQLRMRRHTTHNLGLKNQHETLETQYKRSYFVDWRVCDRLKKQLMSRWNYVLDTNEPGQPRMITGKAYHEAMRQAVTQPFSVVPYFDAGPWGGQWMKEACNLNRNQENYAWCFNCVPEENSLFLRFGNVRMELPSINLVFSYPRELLGDPVHARFGDEFPIRFDFLDTMEGGNLSLQVHPLTEYIQENFGIHYTQDESYYLMDAGEGARVFLGLKEDVEPEKMINDLQESQMMGKPFEDSRHVESWPAKKHDHFLIPGGTVHCSGQDCMVLEISSTPYIFTFKLYDWGRMGMDGKPRSINIERGAANIQWNRTKSWVQNNLVNRIEPIDSGEAWKEEKTGLHKLEFIETRRHWFTGTVTHHTGDSVNVICLVEGDEVIVESPVGLFDPFVVHYAEVFIIPAMVGIFTVRTYGVSEGKECATIKAYVRTNA